MSQENVEIIRSMYERWECGDLATPEFFDADVEYARIGDGGAPDAVGTWQGLDEMWSAVVGYLGAWEEIRQIADRFVDVADGRVLVLDRQLARGRSTGIPVEHEMAAIFTLNTGGKIVRFHAFWDRAEALEAAGLRE
jgi:ketosteroid isomerase-like protein